MIRGKPEGWSPLDRFVHRTFKLPFVPFIGLELVDDDWATQIVSMYYDAKLKHFVCMAMPDERLCDPNLLLSDEQRSAIISEVALELESAGWKRGNV